MALALNAPVGAEALKPSGRMATCENPSCQVDCCVSLLEFLKARNQLCLRSASLGLPSSPSLRSSITPRHSATYRRFREVARGSASLFHGCSTVRRPTARRVRVGLTFTRLLQFPSIQLPELQAQ